jgi:hypothetical protein
MLTLLNWVYLSRILEKVLIFCDELDVLRFQIPVSSLCDLKYLLYSLKTRG